MQPHQQRVVDEKADLDGKIDRLTAFLDAGRPEFVPMEEWQRMHEQRALMRGYSRILGERIAAFPA